MRLIWISVFIHFSISSCTHFDKKHQYAEMVINKVEKFKSTNNRLPNRVAQMGLTEQMNTPAFYEMKNDSTYIVWYGMHLGESNIYYSSTKKWKIEG